MNMQVGNHLYHLRPITFKVGTTLEEIRKLRNVYFLNLGCVCVYVCVPV